MQLGRGIQILQTLGYDVRVLQIEGAKDSDEFIIKYGSGQMKNQMENAISIVEYKVKKLTESLDLTNVSDKISFLNELSKILVKVENAMEKEVYIDKFSKQYNISKESIYSQLNKLQYSTKQGSAILEKPKAIKRIESIKKDNKIKSSDIARENLILNILLEKNPDTFIKIKNVIESEDFKDENNRKIAKRLYEEFEKGNINNVLDLFKEEELINHITYIMSSDLDINDTNKAIDDILSKIKKEKIMNRKNEILKKLTDSNISENERKNLEEELKNLSKKLTN